MSKISCSVHISLIFFKYPFGGIKTPVDPAIGSVIKAAICSAPCFSIIRFKSSARSPPHSGIPLLNAFFSRLWVVTI